MMKIPLKEAKKLSIHSSYLHDLVIDAILLDKKHIELSADEYYFALEKLNEYKLIQKQLKSCVSLNNKGIEYEKSGNIKLAIKTYEKNILNDYPAHHSHKRLMVLYRKNKDYVNELRVIERALEVFPDFPEYLNRLEKVKAIIARNSK